MSPRAIESPLPVVSGSVSVPRCVWVLAPGLAPGTSFTKKSCLIYYSSVTLPSRSGSTPRSFPVHLNSSISSESYRSHVSGPSGGSHSTCPPSLWYPRSVPSRPTCPSSWYTLVIRTRLSGTPGQFPLDLPTLPLVPLVSSQSTCLPSSWCPLFIRTCPSGVPGQLPLDLPTLPPVTTFTRLK